MVARRGVKILPALAAATATGKKRAKKRLARDLRFQDLFPLRIC